MDYFILLLICWGSIFVNTSLFTDTQIFPKWLCFFAGILLYGFYIGLKGFPKKKDSKIPILLSTIVILCTMQALYGIGQSMHGALMGTKSFITGSFDNTAGFASCIVAGVPFLLVASRVCRCAGWFLPANRGRRAEEGAGHPLEGWPDFCIFASVMNIK